MSEINLTVAIPTYNGGSKYLSQVLDALKKQVKTSKVTWEVIVVDNNSTDDTKKLVKKYQKNWLKNVPLGYVFEEKQGAAYARQKAVEEAKGEFVGFLDDDNIPVNNWVIEAYKFGKKYPKAGAWGGQIHGDYEVEPPKGFERIASFLAIREYDKESVCNPEYLILPPGANIIINKKAWLDSVPKELLSNNKYNKIFNWRSFSGEDLEVLVYIQKNGWKIYNNPKMYTYHQIPKKRLKKDYLVRLIRGFLLANIFIRMKFAKTWQKPIIFLKTFAGGFKRLVLLLIKNNVKEIKTDFVLSVELQWYFAWMISPFIWLKLRLIK